MTDELASGHPVTASALIYNDRGHVLIVHRARAGGSWMLPGGLVQRGESPLDAARREVHEELNLDLGDRIRELAAVEWLQATTVGRRDRLAFVFDGPRIGPCDEERILLDPAEIAMWRWMPISDLVLLDSRIAARIVAWLQNPGSTTYRETRNPEGTP